MPGDAPLSEGVDFFGGSQIPDGLSVNGTKESKSDDKVEPAGEEDGDVEVSEREPGTGSDDDEAESDESADDDGDEDETEEDKAKRKGETQQVSHDRKKSVVIKTARKEFKMPPNAKAVVKVDGKLEEVPLSDLMSGYSSNKGITKKIEELNHRERTVTAEREKVGEGFKKFSEKAKDTAQMMAALGDLLDEHGVDPLPFSSGIRRSVANSVLKMIGASQQQIQMVQSQLDYYDNREESLYYKSKVEKQKDQQNSVAKNSEVVREVNRVMAKVGIADIPTFQKSFEALKDLQSKGKLKLEDTTPDDVGTFFLVTKAIERFPELEGDTDALAKLFKIHREFNPSEKEFRRVVRGYLGSGDEQDTAGEQRTPAKPKVAKPSGTKPSKLGDLFI